MPTSCTEIPLYRFCSAAATLPDPVIALIFKEDSEHTAPNPSSDAREPQLLSLAVNYNNRPVWDSALLWDLRAPHPDRDQHLTNSLLECLLHCHPLLLFIKGPSAQLLERKVNTKLILKRMKVFNFILEMFALCTSLHGELYRLKWFTIKVHIDYNLPLFKRRPVYPPTLNKLWHVSA